MSSAGTRGLFPPAPEPKTPLARHRILSKSAAVRVSPLCLGAMNFGDAWKDYLGECNKVDSFKMLDTFWEAGGNFIDTANNYQNQESETWIGEWMEQRNNRDQIVLATKYTTNFVAGQNPQPHVMSNYSGNHSKSLLISLSASLKKLKTSYIDILYFHWTDMSTSIEELMQSLNRLVDRGLVLYLGASDCPAWVVARANQYARDHGMAQFSVYQGLWSAAERDLERDILPMAEQMDIAIAPWGALGRGKFKTEKQRIETEGQGRKTGDPTDKDKAVSAALEKISERKGGVPLTSLALAYVMHASPYNVFPIVGGRKPEHLKENIEALSLSLSEEDMKEIESAVDFSLGFPMNFLHGGKHVSTRLTAADLPLTINSVHLDVPSKLSKLMLKD